MKVSKEQAAENRDRVVETAARLFREHGYNGIGVADLMKGAGLTHGGFYGNFGSKEALMAEAAGRAVATSLADWDKAVARHPEQPLRAVTGAYLSVRHRDHPGQGCAVAALGPDIARLAPEVRSAMTDGIRRQIEKLASLMPAGSLELQRQDALATYAAMVGALVIARTVSDEALSEEVLAAALQAINRNTEE
jgi:TetR/AcrR family transcriptional regulator, transcriptional repressor for nem operon